MGKLDLVVIIKTSDITVVTFFGLGLGNMESLRYGPGHKIWESLARYVNGGTSIFFFLVLGIGWFDCEC